MTPSAPVRSGPLPVGPRRRLGWRPAVVAACVVGGIAVYAVAGDSVARVVDEVPVPPDLVPVFVEAAKSCPTLTAPRLAGQAMAASGLDPSVPMGIAGLSDAVWQTWAPWQGALRSDPQASILGVAHLTCDLVGHLRIAAVPGDPWRLAVAAAQSSVQEVADAGGVPTALTSYVDRVEAYATGYAGQPEFGGPEKASVVPGSAVATGPVVSTSASATAQPTVSPAATTPPGPVYGTTMKIGSSSGASVSIGKVVGKDGKCLHVDADRNAFHAPVQISQCDGSAGQTWAWRTDGTLRTRGYCLSSVDHGLQNGTLLQLDSCTGTLDQVWNPNYTNALYNTGSAYCLDVPFGNTTDGTQLWIWGCNRGNAQTWALTSGAVNGQIRSPVGQGNCLLSSGADGLTQIGLCATTPNQRWTIGVDGKIRTMGAKYCLEVVGQTETSAGGPGTRVGVSPCVPTRSQTWAPQPNGTLQNPVSHLCLSAPIGQAQVGMTLDIEKCVDGIVRQQWVLPILET